MTEAEWLTCTDPEVMLEFLRGKASERKLRLFACACCRELPVQRRLQNRNSRLLIEVAERFLDDLTSWQDVVDVAKTAAKVKVIGGSLSMGASKSMRLSLSSQAERAVVALSMEEAWEAASMSTRMV